jgi:hypothetical protein
MKLTLRDFFWLVLVIAMGCAWGVDRARIAAETELWQARAEFVADSIRFQGGCVVFQEWNGKEAIIDYRTDAS